MKCPKCGYLGFDAVERCRNCGYDFSLNPVQRPPELALRDDRDSLRTAVDELPLSATSPTSDPTTVSRARWDALDDFVEARSNTLPANPATDSERGILETDLPLFEQESQESADVAPLISVPSKPRAPLAVRRATPEGPRRRAIRTRAPMLDLPPAGATTTVTAASIRPRESLRASATFASESLPAGLAARLVATAVDLGVLALIDLVVVYFTLRICGLTLDDMSLVPKAPLLAFLIVQNGGYLVAFNAAGQTLGKMLVGIRVVSTTRELPLDLSRATLRAVVWIALAIPGGLGFLSAVLNADHRGLHDRCAGTCVVRVSTA